jgi:hypothetical protein
LNGYCTSFVKAAKLKYPEDGFEDVIKTHFKLKKDKIVSYLKELKKDKDAELFAGLI